MKAVADLTESDIQALFDIPVAEGKFIDYKRDLPGKTDSDKKEFLFDVSSFANAAGGNLIYGIEERGGIPKAWHGVSIADQDAELLRLQSLTLDGVDPRIPGLEMNFIPYAKTKHVLVIRIPKSWNPPHMVTIQKANKFYTRNSAGRHLLDMEELRSLFSMASSTKEQMNRFRAERLAKIIADETPVAVAAAPRTVLHILPLQSLSSTSRIQLRQAISELSHLLLPLGGQIFSRRINLDGLLSYSAGSPFRAGHDAYIQLYHKGIIETVNASTLSLNRPFTPGGTPRIPSSTFEAELTKQVPQYLIALKALGVPPPFVLMLTLIGVKDYYMAVSEKFMFTGNDAPIDRDVVIVPEIVIEDYECVASNLRPLLDSVWNAAGWPASPNFD